MQVTQKVKAALGDTKFTVDENFAGKVVRKDPEGMRSREKYVWQSLIGLLAALYLVFSISENSNLRVMELFFQWVRSGFDVNLPPKAGLLLPFFKEISYPLGVDRKSVV